MLDSICVSCLSVSFDFSVLYSLLGMLKLSPPECHRAAA